MKKKLSTLIAFLCILTMAAGILSACSSGSGSDSGDPGDTGEEIQVYKVGTEPTYAPFDTTDEDGNVIGFDMDLIEAIAADQGFEIEYVILEFDALIPALESGSIDIIAAGMNANNEERRKAVDFSDSYYETGLVVVVNQKNDTINSIDDFNGDTIANSQIGSVGAEIIQEMEENGTIKKAIINNGFDACLLQVANGDADATIMSLPTAEAGVKKYPNDLKIVGDKLDDGYTGFAVQKGNTELLDKINAGLADVKADGTYDELITKWFEEYTAE